MMDEQLSIKGTDCGTFLSPENKTVGRGKD